MSNSLPTGLTDTARAGAAFGTGMAAIIMTFFGFIWFGWGLGVGGLRNPVGWIVLYVAAILLIIAGVRALRRGKRLMAALGADRSQYWKQRGSRFRIISLLEIIGCGLAVFLATHFHRPELVAPGIALVVGLHFLPLAGLFNFAGYYAVGVAIVACAVASALLLHGNAIVAATGIGTGTVLWLTALAALVYSGRLAGAVGQ
jgi:hypothetical protein